MIRDLCKLHLLAKLMVFLRLILFNLTIAAIAQAILIRISAKQVSSLHMVSPKYVSP